MIKEWEELTLRERREILHSLKLSDKEVWELQDIIDLEGMPKEIRNYIQEELKCKSKKKK